MRKLSVLNVGGINFKMLVVLVILIAITPNLIFSSAVNNVDSSVTESENVAVVCEYPDCHESYDEFIPVVEDDSVIGKVYSYIHQMPKYLGGEPAMYRYVSVNLHYPENAIKNNVQGRVIVKFVVTKSGSIADARVVRSIDPDLDAEAIRLVKSLPERFIPGRFNGQAVNVWYTFPISFRLRGTM